MLTYLNGELSLTRNLSACDFSVKLTPEKARSLRLSADRLLSNGGQGNIKRKKISAEKYIASREYISIEIVNKTEDFSMKC
jgi:hypothetical protein